MSKYIIGDYYQTYDNNHFLYLKKGGKHMNQKTKSKLFKLLRFFVVVFTLLLLSSCYFRVDENNDNYRIKFYDNRTYVDSVYLDVGTTISDEQLKAVEMKLHDYGMDTETYYVWSTNRNKLVYADFDSISWNETVYLFRIKDEYDVNINDLEEFNFEILTEGKIKYGDTVEFLIEPNVDKDDYYITIEINGEYVDLSDDNKYSIEYVQEDIDINVTIKQIATIKPIVEQIHYDGNTHYAEFEFVNNKGELLNADDVEIKYYLNNEEVDGMKDAGTYIVEFRYVGDEYYVLDTIYENYVVGKYEPTLEVIEKEFYYNGEYIGYTVDDVITNSDGEITLINNLNKDVGTYDVTIRVSETNNYEAKEIHVTQTIKKGIPTVISWPTASTGFDGYVLRTVEITGGSANIEGQFIWSNGNKKLEVGTYNYSLSFVPNDPQYETISKDIPVETISIEEALRRIKEERNYLYNTYDNILEDDVYQVEDLDITGDKYPVDITWMSSSTVLMINNLGYVNILDVEGAHRVTLTAIMTYGDAAEYATFEFTLHVGNAQKEVKEAPRQVREKPIPTLSEIGDIVKESQRNKSLIKEIKTEYLRVSTSENIAEQIHMINVDDLSKDMLLPVLNKQKQLFVYNSRCNKHREISEVILWRIISDGASDDNVLNYHRYRLDYDDSPGDISLTRIKRKITYGDSPGVNLLYECDTSPGSNIYLKLESKQKDIQYFMKGEN